jgi:phosphonate transport system substrate-binding protein
MKEEFDGNDRFFPITYKEHWAVVRKIAEKTGTPYTKAAYEIESRREADLLRRNQQEKPQDPR